MNQLKFGPMEQTIAKAWNEVKRDFFDDLQTNTLFILKKLMEASLEEERTRIVNAEWHERKPPEERNGHRNGFTQRSYLTEIGLIEKIRFPRARAAYESHILPRYERMQPEILDKIAKIYLAGVSTRRVEEILACFLKGKASAQKVSEVTASIDRDLKAFHERPLLDHYVYLFLDGIWLSVQTPEGGTKKKVLLVAYGIDIHGKRECIDFLLARSESKEAWEGFLNHLYQRGLRGGNTELVTVDGGKGLLAACELVYPRIPIQRCWAHKMRNVESHLKKQDREECLGGARLIYQAPNLKGARKAFRDWKEKWETLYPKAILCLENDLEEMLSFFQFDPHHWRKIRTTNPIERFFREYRRRTRTMGCFIHGKSAERILFSITRYLNQKWGKKPVIRFSKWAAPSETPLPLEGVRV
jgi:putative transposase